MFTILVEGVISFIIVAALFYVAPGVMGSIKTSAPRLVIDPLEVGNLSGGGGVLTSDTALYASQGTIATTASGGLSISAIVIIVMGIALMIGGFMYIRGRRQ